MMNFVIVSTLEQFTKWRLQWSSLYCAKRNSVFISFEWIAHHLARAESPVIILGVNNNQLRCAFPLQESRLSSKLPNIKSLEHIAKSYTDYHEFLFHKDEDLTSVADQFGRFLKSNFPKMSLKTEFPPPLSKTADFLAIQSVDYQRIALGAHYVFQNHNVNQAIDHKLASDIDRRLRKAEASHEISIQVDAPINDAMLHQALDLHRSHHGETSFNSTASRAEIIELLLALKSQLVCSVLLLDNKLAACALSYKTGEQLQYYAPAMDDSYRSMGLGMILFRHLQLNLDQLGVTSISLLRGEEAYKIRVSDCSASVEPVLWIPNAYSRLKKLTIRLWCGRRNKEVQQRRAALGEQLRRSCAGRYAIVLANGLNGLGVVRALHSEGINVIAISPNPKDMAALSNTPSKVVIEPLDESWEQRILEHLRSFADQIDDNIPLFTCSDRAANFVESYCSQFPTKIKATFPSGELTHILNDKQRELAFADKHDIPIPPSVWDILGERPFDRLTLPIIIKPKDFAGYAVIKAKNIIAEHRHQLDSFYDKYAGQLDLFIAQELIEGPDENLWVCNATFDANHQMVCAFTFRRLGTSPSHFGVTSVAHSEHNQAIKGLVSAIGSAIGYQGPGMWEFKFCPKTEQYLYIETNPRLGMCNWFDTQCNVSNVLANYYLSHGMAVNPLAWEQSTGIYFLNGLGDTVARIEDKEPIRSIVRRLYYVVSSHVVWATWWRSDKRPTFITSFNQIRSLLVRIKNKLI